MRWASRAASLTERGGALRQGRVQIERHVEGGEGGEEEVEHVHASIREVLRREPQHERGAHAEGQGEAITRVEDAHHREPTQAAASTRRRSRKRKVASSRKAPASALPT